MKVNILLALIAAFGIVVVAQIDPQNHNVAFAQEPPSCLKQLEGLVSWWPGDGDTDDIQSNNVGVLKNGAGFARAMIADGFSFDGVDDYLEIPDDASLDVTNGLTIGAWAYFNGFTTSEYHSVIFSKPGAFEVGIRNNGGPMLYAEVHQTGGKVRTISSGQSNVPVDRWVYITLVVDSIEGVITVYIDGSPFISESSTDRSAIATVDAPLYFGSVAGEHAFSGVLDEIELYARPLKSEEIKATVEAGKLGKCTGSVRVILNVVPEWNQTVFEILVNGEVKAVDLVGAGSTGWVRVPVGEQTISRTRSEGRYVTNFVTRYECRNAGHLVVRWHTGATLIQLPVGHGDEITCWMTLYESGCDPSFYDNVIIGDERDNVLVGTEGRDVILGLGGNDTLFGDLGDDCLVGGPGDDLVIGGGGNDVYYNNIGEDRPLPPAPALPPAQPEEQPEGSE